MSYATKQDLEERFGQTDLDQAAYRDALEVDQVIGEALSAADELIDAHCAQRYALPLEPLPGMVRDIALDLAWWKLWKGPIPDDVKDRYREAMRLLAQIRDGDITLQSAGVEAAGVETASDIRVSAPRRTFTGDTLGGL